MNLELVEERCLAYLREVTNPLVSVDALLRYLRRDPGLQDLDQRHLTDFVRNHELIRVVEPPLAAGNPDAAREMTDAGIPMAPRVILATRVPSDTEWLHVLREEVQALIDGLTEALEQARAGGQDDRIRRLRPLLRRAEALLSRLGEALTPPTA